MLGLAGFSALLLKKTRYGRYLYAIGGSEEAAVAAGIKVRLIKILAFIRFRDQAVGFGSGSGETNQSGGEFLIQKMDLMIVQPLDGQALIPVIDKAYSMTPAIPVINLALKIDDKNSVSLESDPILEGRLMGDYAAKKLPQGAKVAILEGEPDNLAAASREQGILEGLKARPDIKVIADLTTHWRRDNADGDYGRLAPGLSAN
jgi:hypothetical protein